MNRNPLTDTEINNFAPSAFAEQPWVGQSERYAFVPTSNVIAAMRQNGYNPVMAAQSRTRIPGKQFFTKHMLRFRSNQPLANVGDSAPEMVLINSHDGTSRYKLMFGMFRLVCSNGLVVSESLVNSISIRHTGDIVNEVLDATNKLIEQAPVVVETINKWRTIELTTQEQTLLAEQAIKLRFEDGVPVRAEQLLKSRRYDDNGNDLYTVFNRIQENVVRGGIRYYTTTQTEYQGRVYDQTRRNKTREVKGIDQNIDLNQALWQIAQDLADTK